MKELLSAIYNSDLVKVEHLLQQVQDIDAPLWHDFNALLYAVFKNELAIVQALLKFGADLNYVIPFNTCDSADDAIDPNAEFISDEPITMELLESIQSLGNVSALHIAVKQNNIDMTKLLLENHADVNVTDQGVCTPLHWAVVQGNEALVALLLKYGARCDKPDITGSTPLDEARRRNKLGIVQLLSPTIH